MWDAHTPITEQQRCCPTCNRPVTGTVISGPEHAAFRPCGHHIHPVKLD